MLLALATRNGWEVHHLDVKSAFLNGELQETVYVTQPEGFVKKNKERFVYKLVKALYGLRQAPRAWYARLSKYLESLGFVKCPYEHAVYTKREGGEVLIIGVYVDDLLVTGTSTSIISKFKKQMGEEFDMSDLGKLSYYLGIEVDQKGDYIELKQSAYAKKLLEKARMLECNPAKYPLEPKLQLSKDEKGKEVNSTQFKSLVGGLRYLVNTRLDMKGCTNMKHCPVVIYVDNKSAIDLAKNPVFHGRSKHIDIRYHFIRECVEMEEIVIKHVSTEKQRADVLTKATSTTKFERMRALLGLRNLQKPA